MIDIPLQNILFLDIETVGITSTYNDLQEKYPMLHKQFHNYFDWFLKRYPEDSNLPSEDVYHNRAALVPDFSKIVCVCMAFVDKEGKVRSQVLKNDDEYALLKEVNHLFERCNIEFDTHIFDQVISKQLDEIANDDDNDYVEEEVVEEITDENNEANIEELVEEKIINMN